MGLLMKQAAQILKGVAAVADCSISGAPTYLIPHQTTPHADACRWRMQTKPRADSCGHHLHTNNYMTSCGTDVTNAYLILFSYMNADPLCLGSANIGKQGAVQVSSLLKLDQKSSGRSEVNKYGPLSQPNSTDLGESGGEGELKREFLERERESLRERESWRGRVGERERGR